MYSTRCPNCKQPFNLKPEEVQAMITEVEAKHHRFYNYSCPNCRRPVKIQINDLKKSLPRPVSETSEPGE